MDKRVILAVAGSGKTYHICNSLNPEKKNLILAFTHENIHNIVSELVKAYGKVPELTTVMTFDAFKYRFLLKPYEFSILSSYSPSIPSIKGITTINSPKNSIVKNGKSIHNPLYINKEKSMFKKAYKVNAIDTTAAGDSYTGALAVAFANNKNVEEAMDFASKVGALSVQKEGAQSSLPTLNDVENFRG